ncbi:hypothetical protein ELB75_10275 [Eikenella corrodens]|uniref:Uncharacterized protein n=1 Tax=Eikenella corrodens TaxID=539 RepID=A0A3S9SLG9_EIKCO|nr:hypothetical protein ELB75_10275 [Eikenella corrodens]
MAILPFGFPSYVSGSPRVAGCLKCCRGSCYSELNLNQYSVGSPCRNVCTICGSPPCPDLNLIHYISVCEHIERLAEPNKRVAASLFLCPG